MDGKRAYAVMALAVERRSELLPALVSARTPQDVRRTIAEVLGCTEEEAKEVETLQLMRLTDETAERLREAIPFMDS